MYDPGTRVLQGQILGANNNVLATRQLTLPSGEELSLDTFGMTAGFNGSGNPALRYDVFMDAVTYSRAIAGDFDGDLSVTPADLDLLCAEVMNAGVDDRMFDLNDDAATNLGDRDMLLAGLGSKLGDTDLDQDVDLSDLGNLATGYNQPGATWLRGDTDCDGDVDLSDLGNLATNYGSGEVQAYADFEALTGISVPEPASIGLVGLAGAAMIRRRRSP